MHDGSDTLTGRLLGIMPARVNNTRLKAVALPVEHGGWGFLCEPILLGLLVAPSVAGVWISLATVAAFLLKRPLKLFLTGNEPLSKPTRRRVAMYVSIAYLIVAAIGLWLGVSRAGFGVLVPLLVLFPFVVVYLLYDTRKQSKRLLPEMAGPIGLLGVAPSIALSAGDPPALAWALWAILLARTIPSILYVRARLRLERGEKIRRAPVVGWHVGFLAGIGVLVVRGSIPLLTVAGLLMLLIRAVHGLSSMRRRSKVTRIGFLEIAYGLIYILVTVLGYRFPALG